MGRNGGFRIPATSSMLPRPSAFPDTEELLSGKIPCQVKYYQ